MLFRTVALNWLFAPFASRVCRSPAPSLLPLPVLPRHSFPSTFVRNISRLIRKSDGMCWIGGGVRDQAGRNLTPERPGSFICLIAFLSCCQLSPPLSSPSHRSFMLLSSVIKEESLARGGIKAVTFIFVPHEYTETVHFEKEKRNGCFSYRFLSQSNTSSLSLFPFPLKIRSVSERMRPERQSNLKSRIDSFKGQSMNYFF